MLWLVHKLGEDNFGANWKTSPSWFPLGYFVEDYCLTRGQNHLGGSLGQETPHCKQTHPGDLGMFVGTLISTTPAVWKAPLHYRALQRSLIISLKEV